ELIGADGVANAFTINGANSGSIGGTTFTNVGSLTGGNGDDTFTFTPTGSLSIGLRGKDGTDTVTGPDVETKWTINGQNTGSLVRVTDSQDITTFLEIENLHGGSADDTFDFSVNVVTPGSVSGLVS